MAHERTTVADEPTQHAAAEDYYELQDLLLQPYVQHLQSHRDRIDRLEEIAGSEAVARSLAKDSKEDPKIRKVLHPVVEDALRISVDENPSVMAGILFPMIGEAVRKAVAASTQQMMDSTNDLLANSLSAERIGWRFEAWRSGKSFAEVALAKTLSYRVEHIYVIHRTTGLLMGQVTNQDNLLQDSDMVVGMLTAIQDFVRDSFTSNKGSDLDVIQVGEFKIWLQHGPVALLAAVISGQPKPALRAVLQQKTEEVHKRFGVAMARFEETGRAIPGMEESLEEGLVQEVNEGAKTKQSYTKFKVAGWILLLLICAVAFFYGRRAIIWGDYIKRLRHTPGIVVVEASRDWTGLTVRGFRDPMAADPVAMLENYDFRWTDVSEHWEPYYSLDPRFVGVRRLNGEADALRRSAVRFQFDSTTLPPDQLAALDTIGGQILELAAEARQQRRSLRIRVFGHTDSSGTSEHNDLLSQSRAEAVVRILEARGIDGGLLSAAGLRDTQLGYSQYAQGGQDLDRRVTFGVDLR